MKQNVMKRGVAFTLPEVITVLAIVAVLPAVLIPVLIQSKRKSQAATCLSNMGQLGRALSTYLGDNDGYWPNITAATAFSKQYHIPPCPAFDTRLEKNIYPDFVPTGYVLNAAFIGVPEARHDSINENKIPYPAVTVAAGEENAATIVTGWLDVKIRGRRHNGGGNFLFCDGHVKWHHPDAVGTCDDMKGNNGQRPTFDTGLDPLPPPSP